MKTTIAKFEKQLLIATIVFLNFLFIFWLTDQVISLNLGQLIMIEQNEIILSNQKVLQNDFLQSSIYYSDLLHLSTQ